MQSGKTPAVQDYYKDVSAPGIADMEIQLQQLVEQGLLTPEDAKAALAGESAMSGITLDPSLKAAQLDALAGLQDISGNGGMTLSDQSNLNKIQDQINTSARGSREAILQNAQQRGMGGSGLEMLSQMQNQQDAATRASQQGTDIAAQAKDRALQALIQGGETAGNIRGQDFNEKAQVAGAQDAISKFNAQNQQQVNIANTAARNNAQAANLQNKQNIANQNTNNANTQQQYNKNLKQQDFQNQLQIANGRNGVATTNATNQGLNSQRSADAFNNTIGMGLTAGAMFSDERGKCDVDDFDPSDFLDKITGYTYKYKDKNHGEGEHAGVMAQDLEKSKAGSRLVVDTPEGKVVDYGKSGPVTFASLADLNKRLRKLEGAG